MKKEKKELNMFPVLLIALILFICTYSPPTAPVKREYIDYKQLAHTIELLEELKKQ